MLVPPTFGQTRAVARRRPANTFGMLVRVGLALIDVMRPALAVAGYARLQKAKDSRMERSILALATTVWTCWQTHQTLVQAARHYATVKD